MAGVNWNNVSMLTPGMKNLGSQFNARFPSRAGTSDGAIGDYAHSQGTSGHNPDDTTHDNAEWDGDSDTKKEIRAIDVDKDLNDPRGATMQQVIDHMRRLPGLERVIRYMIYRGKMYHVRDNFEPTNYSGSNQHTEHAHFSGAWSQAADENTSFDFKFEQLGDRVATQFNAEDREILKAEATAGSVGYVGGGLPSWPGKTSTSNFLNAFTYMFNMVVALQGTVEAIAAKVDLDPAEIQAIKDSIDVPSAEENAQALVEALSIEIPTLADLLRQSLTPEALAELIAELNE